MLQRQQAAKILSQENTSFPSQNLPHRPIEPEGRSTISATFSKDKNPTFFQIFAMQG